MPLSAKYSWNSASYSLNRLQLLGYQQDYRFITQKMQLQKVFSLALLTIGHDRLLLTEISTQLHSMNEFRHLLVVVHKTVDLHGIVTISDNSAIFRNIPQYSAKLQQIHALHGIGHNSRQKAINR